MPDRDIGKPSCTSEQGRPASPSGESPSTLSILLCSAAPRSPSEAPRVCPEGRAKSEQNYPRAGPRWSKLPKYPRAPRVVMTWCVVLLKRHSSIVRHPGRYVQARSAIPSSTLSSQGGAGGKLVFIPRGGEGLEDKNEYRKHSNSVQSLVRIPINDIYI